MRKNKYTENKFSIKKTVIILSILTLITSSCATKNNYYREIYRVYFTDKSGRELAETLSGMPMKVCIESRKTDKLIVEKLSRSEQKTVRFQIKAPAGRKFKDGSDVMLFEAKVNRKGKACKKIIIEYEPIVGGESN